ncbi:hypothetical protein C8R44DRAFT_618762, partial [Mycena epipterygia]
MLEYFAAGWDAESTVKAVGLKRAPKRAVYLKRSKVVRPRPPRTKKDNFVLTAYVKINGKEAFTLFNSGCTTEACSPDFARVAGIEVFPIESEIVLQLGTAGSRSKINHGMMARVDYDDIHSDEYMDIVNLDRFDMIIGTKFIRKHKISLDFEYDTIRVSGVPATMLTEKQEVSEVERRNAVRYRWMELSIDIMSGVPEKMPPLRAVNHRIPLIDENLVYNYHLPRCPDAMKSQLLEKISRYTRAGWWEAVQTNQAAPMLCIPK